MNSDYIRPVMDPNSPNSMGGKQAAAGNQDAASLKNRMKPQMQTNLNAMGGAPIHINDDAAGAARANRDGSPTDSEGLLKFDEIVLVGGSTRIPKI